jgi:RNA polymerase sigma-70 factor (ECF subfamily)
MPTPDNRRRFEQEVLPLLGGAYRLASWLLRDPHDAEDAVQEAVLRAYRFFDGFRGDSPRAWLLAIVRNTCLTWRGQHPRGEHVPLDTVGPDPLLDAAGARSPTPEAELSRRQDRERLWRALAALPLEFREVVVLRELEELSYKEIGAVADLPLGTVMSRLFRGRTLLKEILTQRGERESLSG